MSNPIDVGSNRDGGEFCPHEIKRPVMRQRWVDATFAHWPVEPDLVRAVLPAGLEPDLFDGRAWVSLVGFDMDGLRVTGLPPIPTTSHFPEFNVRTYGKAYADQVVASKNTDRIAVNPGGSVFEAGPQMPATQGGGDPSGSGAGMEMGSFWSFFDLEGPQGVAERTKASPVRVRSQQDVAALPKGAHFIDPRDGVTVRVKP